MHSQSQRAILYLVSKGKFHFVSVPLRNRASHNSLEDPVSFLRLSKHRRQNVSHLAFLDFQLLLIGNRLVQTASADSKMGTRMLCPL